MNILMALSQLEVTGAEVYGTVLSDELIRRGNKVYIVSDTLTKPTNAQYEKIEFNKRKLKDRVSQVRKLLKIIKEKDIQVVHAHSRASSWSCAIACRIAKIPLITTIHGRQPVHLSRKLVKAFGDYSLSVCENIRDHIVNDLKVKPENITVLRNMINTKEYQKSTFTDIEKNQKVISIIGRLSGPKGDVTYNLLDILHRRKDFKIQVIGGKEVPARFKKFTGNVEFLGYVNNVSEKIRESSIVIGAGRVAVEAILCEVPVLAIGEAESVGIVTLDRLNTALKSNFGDISLNHAPTFRWTDVIPEIDKGFNINKDDLKTLRERVIEEFSIESIVENIEKVYQREIVKKKKYEMPVIMYHRVIKDESEKGVHGTYVTVEQFEEQMKYLKKKGYETVTFKDLLNNRYKQRFDKDKKWIMLTFDDGYKDNYENAFPILKKYQFKGIIYVLDGIEYNKWDVDNPGNPEKRFTLMNQDELLEMQNYGIEFGGHTSTHPRLAELSTEQVKSEIINSKSNIEKIIGKELLSFAYPYGSLNEEVKRIPQEAGYKFAVATDSGSIVFSDDLFEIRRIGIFPTNNLFNFKRKVSGKYNFIKVKREEKSYGKK
ncbi:MULTISPECIES: polysaccharide deacetylase family protein [Cetobacterium]|mgnify:FL=1|uniref:polysaccharide deacetylase family protein n=1 Tax=Cetobacterium TaxID=180162 RepID=UPI00163C2068|nr:MULTISPECIES: polysaccharide deacetylase family protein [Cetobacterium]MBC2853574.1 polysaccharide deacetylase family protein [Cetobacterium sp. 2G large]WVJ01857.1 polysaccharide deacetylase family protein [Cetobacterium somerae]